MTSTAEDEALLATRARGFDDVGALLEKSRQKAAINEAMRVVAEVNKYLSDMAPWKLKTEDPARMATVLHVALQAVSDCNTILTPFLPHSAQQVHELLGGTGVWSGLPEVREVSEEGNADYPVIQGDYADAAARWESIPIEVGDAAVRPDADLPQARPVDRRRGAGSPGDQGRGVTDGPTRARGGPAAGPRVRPPAPEPLRVPVVDSHSHLDIADPPDDWLSVDDAIAASTAAGVPRIVQIGCDLPGARWAVETANRYDELVAGVALHPNEAPLLAMAGTLDAGLAEIDALAADPVVRAVGETGLDHYRTAPEGRADQEASFRAHIEMAKRHGKALVIHDRDAHDEVLRVLEDAGPPERVVFHCFSGDAAMAEHCVRRGWCCPSPARSPSRTPPGCARRSPGARWTSCWSRPTRPSSLRCPTAGGPTRRTSSRTRCGRWPRSRVSTRTSSRARSLPAPRRPSAAGSRVTRQREPDSCSAVGD